jgi:hypothetical protein
MEFKFTRATTLFITVLSVAIFLTAASPSARGSENYYIVLGVSRDSNEVMIKKAYRRLAMRYHPDRIESNLNGLSDNEKRKKIDEAEENFKKIKEAYEVLISPQKRAVYDKFMFPEPPKRRNREYPSKFNREQAWIYPAGELPPGLELVKTPFDFSVWLLIKKPGSIDIYEALLIKDVLRLNISDKDFLRQIQTTFEIDNTLPNITLVEEVEFYYQNLCKREMEAFRHANKGANGS